MPVSGPVEVTFRVCAERTFDPEAFLAAHPGLSARKVSFVDELSATADDAFPVEIEILVGTERSVDAAVALGARWLEDHRSAVEDAHAAGAAPTLAFESEREILEELARATERHLPVPRWSPLGLRIGCTFLLDDRDDRDDDEEPFDPAWLWPIAKA